MPYATHHRNSSTTNPHSPASAGTNRASAGKRGQRANDRSVRRARQLPDAGLRGASTSASSSACGSGPGPEHWFGPGRCATCQDKIDFVYVTCKGDERRWCLECGIKRFREQQRAVKEFAAKIRQGDASSG